MNPKNTRAILFGGREFENKGKEAIVWDFWRHKKKTGEKTSMEL